VLYKRGDKRGQSPFISLCCVVIFFLRVNLRVGNVDSHCLFHFVVTSEVKPPEKGYFDRMLTTGGICYYRGMKKRSTKPEASLARISANIDTLIENDKLVLSQFDKLQDEVGTLRNDVYEIKEKTTSMSLRLYEIERDLKTVQRVVQEEPEKRRALEQRIRQVVPNLPK